MAAKEFHEKEYRSDHEVYVLDKINRFREEKKLCDVTFKVENKEIHAHRNILAGFCKYYENMFLSEFKESFQDDIEVKGVQAPILSLLFTFIYTAVITINSETVYQIYETANMLQFKYVDEYCVNFLRDTLNVGNCIGVRAFAQKYQISELVKTCEQFIVGNYEKVLSGLEFKELTFDESESILAMKNKQKCCEETMFRSILNWIKHDFENRLQFFERLFQLVDVTKLSTKFLREVSQKSETWLKTSKVFVNEVFPELFNRIPQFAQDNAEAEVRSEFMVVGGKGKASKLVSIYDVTRKEWRKMKSTLDGRNGSTIVKINNHVYTAGGWDGRRRINTVECFNLNQVDAGWQKVASMIENRNIAASAVLNDHMYTVGGWNGHRVELSSGEAYNPATNTWTSIAPMRTKRFGHALVSYNGRIYAFGGYDGISYLNSMECFDPMTGKWEGLASMKEKRSGLSGVVCNDDIYAIGGEGLNKVECYNVRTNTWSDAGNLNYKRYDASACVVNGNIYVIGGEGKNESTTVEVYDPVIKEWKIETNMDIPRISSSVVAL